MIEPKPVHGSVVDDEHGGAEVWCGYCARWLPSGASDPAMTLAVHASRHRSRHTPPPARRAQDRL